MLTSLFDALDKLSYNQTIGLFPKNNDDVTAAAAPFVQSGLARGEKCILACGHELTDVVLSALRSQGIDVADSLQRGTIVADRFHPFPNCARGTDRKTGVLADAIRFVESGQHTAIRVLLQSSALLGPMPGLDVTNDLLDELAGFVAENRAIVLCVHEAAQFPADVVPVLLRAHPYLVHGRRLLENLYHLPKKPAGKSANAVQALFESLDHLGAHADQLGKVRRQAIRLARSRDITLSIMTHTAASDLLTGIVEGVASLGYRLCWIGMARPDGKVEPVAVAGDRSGYLREVSIRWDDTPEGRGPVGTSIRKEEQQIIKDVVRSRRFKPWRETAMARNFLSVASIPLRVEGRTVGALSAYSTERSAFDSEAVEELSAFALQASLALQRDRDHRRLARSEERLRRMFEQIPAACFTFDREGRLVDLNLHCRRLFALIADAGVGTSVLRFFDSAESVARAQDVLRQLFDGKSFSNLEWEVSTGGQKTLRLLTNIYPYRGASETVELGIGIGVEVPGGD